MDIVTPVLLGIVEGLTEFIPVSSTGHLVLAGALLGFHGEASKTFDVVIQLGAILAVIVLYWRRFWDVMVGLLRMEQGPVAFTRNILLGFLPSMVAGALAYNAIRAMLESPTVVAWALIAGGIAILAIERMAKTITTTSVEAMGWRTALGIGIIQCLSLVPGVSRSGATIMGALVLGVERKTAAEFSFFVAVPTMLAASSYSMLKDGVHLGSAEIGGIAIGFVVSFIVALVVIKAFVAMVSRFGFTPFAWYRIIAGAAALVWLGGH
ncbi:undecaprenyl-diphosphate phosphatase [Sphingobium subterraneum]|uniref:Undecaprenyl-diphosphatase n=1 Tax=Sphingobium subterraneum TaxID=627688 RepID=A0A841J1Z5_9SPHN|nr:undecaprenyl-diphosphate phosphatase [Sphingobium subterraneum]MBB6124680.1 undecaprenyl-diphosphatase [Sphingobium subterraneum]